MNSVDKEPLTKQTLLLKEILCIYGSKSFSLRFEPEFGRKAKLKMAEFLPLQMLITDLYRPGISWFNWAVSFAQCCYSVSPQVCFILVLILISIFLR